MSAVLNSGHGVPAELAGADAFTRPAKTRPIALPSRRHVEELSRFRANADNERWQQQVERRDMLISCAAQDGYERGERAGYLQGWHWGLVCGAVAGGAGIGVLWLCWAPLQGLLAAWGLA